MTTPTIFQLPTPLAGTVGVRPVQKYMVVGDNLATVTAAGYLNGINLEGYPIEPSDVIQMLYGYSTVTKKGTYGIFVPSIANGVITLSQWVDSGNVLLPVVSGNIASFNGTTGQIQDSGIVASNVMQINAINVMAASGRITLAKVNGTEAANAVTTAAGNAGVITTSSLTTAGGSSYAITWTNSAILSTSSIQLSLMGGTNTTKNITIQATAGTGTSTLTIYNNTAATVLNGTVLIGYAIL